MSIYSVDYKHAVNKTSVKTNVGGGDVSGQLDQGMHEMKSWRSLVSKRKVDKRRQVSRQGESMEWQENENVRYKSGHGKKKPITKSRR